MTISEPIDRGGSPRQRGGAYRAGAHERGDVQQAVPAAAEAVQLCDAQELPGLHQHLPEAAARQGQVYPGTGKNKHTIVYFI